MTKKVSVSGYTLKSFSLNVLIQRHSPGEKTALKSKESITLPAYDIINEEIKWVKDVTVSRVHKTVNGTLFDKRIFDSDTKDGIYSASTGLEGQKLSATSTENI